METFEVCREVSRLLDAGSDADARNLLIQLLDEYEEDVDPYGQLVNHLVRSTGLYPYIRPEFASWQDRFVYEAFKVDVGSRSPATLHREQSMLLQRLLDGEDLAVSAPTSFGKSFVIDAFIAIRRPNTVVILVPTLALTDETRRRLQKKFGDEYLVITTAGVELREKSILVFPQERLPSYLPHLDNVDLLVVDEFYKAGATFDKERSPALLRAIIDLRDRAKQRYFLAPHISTVPETLFTKGMHFERLDFNTVFLEQIHLYDQIDRNPVRKRQALIDILEQEKVKTLIYAGTYTNIDRVANIVTEHFGPSTNKQLEAFASWLSTNYDPNWSLPAVVRRGFGIHNGRLHRALSQIQVKLFEDQDGLQALISTTPIVEGVNTSARNVVIWSNRKGTPRLDDFTYKNIMGRGGRMFKHFVGKIYILEPPPESEETQLVLELPDEILGGLDPDELVQDLTADQITRIERYRDEMRQLIGADSAGRLEEEGAIQGNNWTLVKEIVRSMVQRRHEWSRLRALRSDDVAYWDPALYLLLNLMPGKWDIQYSKFVAFIKVLTRNWEHDIPTLLYLLDDEEIGADTFFKLERNASYKLAALVNDVSVIGREVIGEEFPDIAGFGARLSHAFLPNVVYQLEEYGLPRMISKKIHLAGLFDMNDENVSLPDAISWFREMGPDVILGAIQDLDDFDVYILRHFFDGITPSMD